MKVDFLGFQGNRQHHQDWALDIIPETDFEKSFFSALFRSSGYRPTGLNRQMQPIATMLCREGTGVSVMIDAENFCESDLVKAREQIVELEKANKALRQATKEA